MNHYRLTRRLVAGAASLTLGVAGALAFAAPASAHHTTVEGDAECTPSGEWRVSWSVGNSEHDLAGALSGVNLTVEPAEAADQVELTSITQGVELPIGGLTEELVLPNDTTVTSITLEVDALWIRNGDEIDGSDYDTVQLEGTCDAPEQVGPIVVSVSTCDLLVFILDNSEGTAEAQFTFTPGETATHGHASGFSLTFDENGEVEDVEAAEDAGIHEVVGEADSENPVQLTFPAGAELHAHAFEAFDGLEVAVGLSLDGEPTDGEDDVVVWERPEDCEDGGGQGGGDDDSGLPVTGASTGLIAGGALALLALGGGLYLVARHRRVTFTA